MVFIQETAVIPDPQDMAKDITDKLPWARLGDFAGILPPEPTLKDRLRNAYDRVTRTRRVRTLDYLGSDDSGKYIETIITRETLTSKHPVKVTTIALSDAEKGLSGIVNDTGSYATVAYRMNIGADKYTATFIIHTLNSDLIRSIHHDVVARYISMIQTGNPNPSTATIDWFMDNSRYASMKSPENQAKDLLEFRP